MLIVRIHPMQYLLYHQRCQVNMTKLRAEEKDLFLGLWSCWVSTATGMWNPRTKCGQTINGRCGNIFGKIHGGFPSMEMFHCYDFPVLYTIHIPFSSIYHLWWWFSHPEKYQDTPHWWDLQDGIHHLRVPANRSGLRRKNQRPRRGWRVWSPPWGAKMESCWGREAWMKGIPKMIEDGWCMKSQNNPKYGYHLTCLGFLRRKSMCSLLTAHLFPDVFIMTLWVYGTSLTLRTHTHTPQLLVVSDPYELQPPSEFH